jgi:hypothetical protein
MMRLLWGRSSELVEVKQRGGREGERANREEEGERERGREGERANREEEAAERETGAYL